MTIKFFGTGCKRCVVLEENLKEALRQTGIKADYNKIEDIRQILDHGIMTTPAIIIDGKTVVKGNVATVTELKELFQNYYEISDKEE